MARMPSGSRVERAMACDASTVLPAVGNVNEYASAGTAVHAYVADARKNGRDAALAAVADEYRDLCDAIDLEGLPAELQAEVALAYDVETEAVRFIGLNVGRNYGEVAPSEIPMSLDLAGVVDGVAYVGDLKTGRGKVPPAYRNWQIKVGAVAVARWKGLDSARVAIIQTADERPRYDVADLDALELSMAAEELRQLWGRVVAAELDYEVGGAEEVRAATGEHCKYCPSRIYCPAQTALIRRIAGEPAQIAEDIRILLTPETATKAYERLRAVEDALRPVKTALYAYASETPIQLGDGMRFGPVTVERDELDGKATHEVLTALYGPEVAKEACDFETSKAAIERAIKPVVKKAKAEGQSLTIKGCIEEVLGAVEAAGGVTKKQRTEMKEHPA